MLNDVYLRRLDLRVTDVAQTFAQRWWSGAFFVVISLAGLAVAATLYGLVYQRETFGRRLTVPFAPPAPVGWRLRDAARRAHVDPEPEAGLLARVRAAVPGASLHSEQAQAAQERRRR